MKQATIVILFMLIACCCGAQDPNQIRNKCQQDLNDIANKVSSLNNDYENIKSDLRQGLFCSLCSQSKTELDKTYSGGFYKHVQDVKGQVKSATSAQLQQAHQRYEQKYNSLKSQYESKQKSCNDNYQAAVAANNRRQAEEQKQQEQKRQSDAAAQQQKQQDAYAKAQQEKAAELQRQQDLILQQKQEELARQQEFRQNLLAASEQLKDQAMQLIAENTDRLLNEIKGIEMPLERIGFAGNGNSGGSNNADQLKRQSSSVDDFSTENSDFNQAASDADDFLLSSDMDDENKGIFRRINQAIQNVEQTSRLYKVFSNNYQRVKDAVTGHLKGTMRDKINDWLDEDPYLPSTSYDKNVGKLIDNNSSGQNRRNMHFIYNYASDAMDRTMNIIEQAGTNEEYNNELDYNPAELFLEHTPTLFPQNYTLREAFEQIKPVVAAKQFLSKASAWVFGR